MLIAQHEIITMEYSRMDARGMLIFRIENAA